MKPSLVSVIIPTFNRAARAVSAIQSVLNQTHQNCEILVVDDASTDDTVSRLQTIHDPRLNILSNTRKKGPSGARNTGMLQARGEYIAFLDSDDLFLPNHLHDGVAALSLHSDYSLVFGKARYFQAGNEVDFMGPKLQENVSLIQAQSVEPDGVLFTDFLFSDLLRLGCFFNLSSVMFRRQVVDEGFLMDEDLYGVDDYEYWLRLSTRYRFIFLPSLQIDYSVSEDGISGCNTDEKEERFFQEILKLFDKVLNYPALTPGQRRFARNRLAQDYFDHGYQVRRRGDGRRARALYRASFLNRPQIKTLLAMAKTFLARRGAVL